MKKIILTLLLATTVNGFSETINIGRTYSIIEPDAFVEIQQKAQAVNWEKELNKKTDHSAFQSIRVPYALDNKERTHQNIYTVPKDVLDHNGKVIYPKGYKYNPLDYVNFTRRVIVIRKDHTQWLEEFEVLDSDMIILADDDLKDVAIKLKRQLFLLDEKTRFALDIEVAPSVITQVKNELIINEYEVERDEP